ncbi:MAG: response regulator transcription factor [Alphaproteobacteria bacterium]|nr:response regulator transcription factor [Alphaproteobacteria bacterium]MBV8410032.1 response regulator transcription factor [Alphaproteobacteria bacterium]
MAASDRTSPNQAASPQGDPGLVRVLVVSSVRLFQEAFAALLGRQCGIAVVGAASPPQASQVADQVRPDIVLFDASRQGNLDYAKQLADQHSGAKVVAFGVAEPDADVVTLAAAGISGYVRNDTAADDVAAVLISTMRGELLCSPRAAATLCHQVALLSRTARADTSAVSLSKRELQIAGLIDRGLSNKEIARRLGIQAATVKNHVHNILDKLKVHRRGEAVACLRKVPQERIADTGTLND